ncbi:MAG TPA: hypothetical protein VFT98_04820, partial [Myxococcota bacterium]|nr:hypothetical protein [Myxococcota bacterium]
MNRRLETALPDEALFPREAAFMARTDASRVRMLGFTPLQLDSVTTMFGGLFGRRPSVRHRSGVSAAARALLERAGIALAENVLEYEDAEQAEALADDLIARGWRLASPYPLRERRFPSEAQIVAPALWERLNDKARFGELAPAGALPERSVCEVDAIGALEIRGAVFVKSAGAAATGWGFGVRRCESRAALLQAQ